MDWNATLYRQRHAFVWRGGEDLVDLLDPQPGEHILDAGCGTGELAALIAARGAAVTGLDNSAAMLAQARTAHPGIEFVQGDLLEWSPPGGFDGILSNAVLHWVRPPERAAQRLFQALKPGGRLVVELGGTGNVASLLEAMGEALGTSGAPAASPWYFPSLGQHALLLEDAGFEVLYAILFERVTGLEGGEQGLDDWLEVFGAALPGRQKWEASLVERFKDAARARLFDHQKGRWTVDYRRLRLAARRPY